MNPSTRLCLIALRIAIGWHFLYEGIYKVDSNTGAVSNLTSHYALQASTARLRDAFQKAPPGSLDRETALARADQWHDEIVRAFAAQKALGEDQKARLAALRDQVKLNAIAASRGEIPPEDVVNFDWTYVHAETLKVPPPAQAERFTSLAYLQSSAGPARGLFRALVPDIDGLERLTVASAHSRLDRRYDEILAHYADAGLPFSPEQQTKLAKARDAVKSSLAATISSPAFQARLADYRALLRRVSSDGSALHAPFTRERLDADRKALDAIASDMLAFVNESISEMAVQTYAIATVRQLAAGPLPADTHLWVDTAIQFSLIAIGASLMLGLFTPIAALAAAAQLLMFYLASPPWPGLPAASLGGHYLFIDRNLIELLACLLLRGHACPSPQPSIPKELHS
jgi:uncharacterized membrane protein YphA (DoxX/SURF4 family)